MPTLLSVSNATATPRKCSKPDSMVPPSARGNTASQQASRPITANSMHTSNAVRAILMGMVASLLHSEGETPGGVMAVARDHTPIHPVLARRERCGQSGLQQGVIG